MLDHNGNFKSDMTVTRIKDGEYFCVTASVGKRHDQHWLMENLPADGSVCMEDVTYKLGCLVLAGPKSRDVLAKACYDDVSNEAFAFRHQPEIYVGRVKCRVNRMNYVGELGYEIFHPIESQIAVFQTLHGRRQTARPEDVRYVRHGFHAPRKRLSGLEERNERAPHPAGNQRGLDGEDEQGLHRQGRAGKAEGRWRAPKLVCLVCQADDADPWGYNPIFNGDRSWA
jgi:dimethylglycine dehydrogenase